MATSAATNFRDVPNFRTKIQQKRIQRLFGIADEEILKGKEKLMKRICILDPGAGSPNTGDLIISSSVRKELADIFGDKELVTLPTQRVWNFSERKLAAGSDIFIFGGSNILSHNFPLNFQWKIRPEDLFLIRGKLVLFGVGRWQYGEMLPFSSTIWKKLLSVEAVHSVRDSVTQSMVTRLGRQALNTGCPTIWGLEPRKYGTKNKQVVITLTDYKRAPERDMKIVKLAQLHYEKVFLWPQGGRDAEYFQSLGVKCDGILDRSLEAFHTKLLSGADYLGTRLHGGISALQLGNSAVVVAVDNRSRDMASDFGLPVILEPDEDSFLAAYEVGLSNFSKPNTHISEWLLQIRSFCE